MMATDDIVFNINAKTSHNKSNQFRVPWAIKEMNLHLIIVCMHTVKKYATGYYYLIHWLKILVLRTNYTTIPC
jgi:hypothetical protein